MNSDRFKYLLLVAMVSAAMFFLYGKIEYTQPEYTTWDLHDYRTMAQAAPDITHHVRQPFVYRIFGPFIAGILPLSTDSSFLVLSGFAAVTLSCIFFLFLNAFFVPPSTAALATIFSILNKYLYGFPTWNYFHVNDLLSQIEIVLLFWAMFSQKWLWFGGLMLIGSLTRETSLLLIPAAFVFAYENTILKQIWPRLVLAILPAIVCAIFLRFALHPSGGHNLIEAFAAYSDKAANPDTWFRLFINSFIPFSAIPVIYYETAVIFFRKRMYAVLFLALVLFSTFFGYNIERLMAPAFVIFYSLLAVILRRHFAHSPYIIWGLIIPALLCTLHHTYARFPLPRDVTVAISMTAFLLVTIASMYHKRRSSNLRIGIQSEG